MGVYPVIWSDRIKAIRTRLGLSQSALAERLGADARTVGRWEGGTLPGSMSRAALEAMEAEAAGAPALEALDWPLRMRRLRARLGGKRAMTARALAKLLGVHWCSISRWEREDEPTIPSRMAQKKIAELEARLGQRAE